jgi:hypothetical protein
VGASACNVKPLHNIVEAHITWETSEGLAVPTKNGFHIVRLVTGNDILTQIAAVRAGLDQVGKAILEHRIEHSITQAVEYGRAQEAIRDLKDALDRFV